MALKSLSLSILVGIPAIIFCNVSEEYCHDYLVSGPGGIPNNAFQCSSTGDPRYQRITFIRLFTLSTHWFAAGAWCAFVNDTNKWFQVDLGENKKVKTIVTRGTTNNNARYYRAYTTSYQLSYRRDDGDWTFIKNPNGTIKTFAGNDDHLQTLFTSLPETIVARFVKIHLKTCEKKCCLQFDVIGCAEENKFTTTKIKQWRASLFRILNPNNGMLWKRNSKNHGFCSQHCFRDPSCVSFAFNAVDEQCQGHDEEKLEDRPFKRQPQIWFQRAYSECIDGFQIWKSGFCYKVYTIGVNTNEADSICRRSGTNLCQMTSINDTRQMWEITRSNQVLKSDDTFHVDGRYDNGTDSWKFNIGVDLMRAVNASWNATYGHCVHLTGGTVDVGPCSQTRWFICTHTIST